MPASWSSPFKLFTVLARDERPLLRWTGGAVSYLEPSHVTVRQREVLLLLVTARCRCAYEWDMRVHYFADQADLSDDQILRDGLWRSHRPGLVSDRLGACFSR